MKKHNVIISKQYVDDIIQSNAYYHHLNGRLIQEIEKARLANQILKQQNETLIKENDLLRDIRYEYEYAKRTMGGFVHESPI